MYFKNLDFLRFIAIALVIFQHWVIHLKFVDTGAIGVTIFFVLSGFLITRILLQSRVQIEIGKLTVKRALSNFYFRRSIRIFPVYFLLLIFLIGFNYKGLGDNTIWFLTYTSNIKTYIDQSWMGTMGPLWSLAVEEQFYFIWPAIILLIPKEKLKKALVFCLAAGSVFRLLSIVLAYIWFDQVDLKVSSTVLMPSNIDLFAIGGVLAYNVFYNTNMITVSKKLIVISSFVLFAVCMYFYNTIFYHVFFVAIIGVWSYFIIEKLIDEEHFIVKKFNAIFSFKPFVFLGKVSYGLYLYHGPFFFIIAIISFLELKFFGHSVLFGGNQETKFKFLKNIVYLILFSSLSWYMLENPINKLKRYFV